MKPKEVTDVKKFLSLAKGDDKQTKDQDGKKETKEAVKKSTIHINMLKLSSLRRARKLLNLNSEARDISTLFRLLTKVRPKS